MVVDADKNKRNVPHSIRLSDNDLAVIDAAGERLARDARGARATRSPVIRILLRLGLEVLNQKEERDAQGG